VRAAALAARHEIQPFKVEELWAVFNTKDEGVMRAAETRILAEIRFDDLVSGFDRGIEYSKFDNMRAFVDELIARPSGTNAKSLVAVMVRGHNERLGWWIADVLDDWSGQSHRLDVEAWKKWSDTVGPGWAPKTSALPRKPKSYPSEAGLLGLPILSRSFAILIDMTGWTAEKDAAGATGKARFKTELGKTLRSLSDYSTFKIVPYASAPAKCGRDWLAEVRMESINDALRCFGECTASGKDNFLEAAEMALALPGIDSILVVTDSAPGGAHHVHPELVLEQMTQMNRFHGVFIEAVLIHPKEEMTEQWTNLCAPSGGRVMTAEW
jgi:hypothetical protein